MSIDLKAVPMLGFGLMRLPEKDGQIDLPQVCEMVDAYLAAGLNYFDTAYVYHGGNSEKIVKEAIVKRHPRESFTVATKLPAWCMKDLEDRDRIFNEQLERCGVDYFDFYLLHSIEDGGNGDTYDKLKCFDWGLQKRDEGKIRHFGFSFHGSPEYLEDLLEDHPEVEFVQIQMNYADWENPVVCSGKLYEILQRRDIPIIIMEPVKGGTLAKLTPELEAKFRALRPDKSIASWALRFAASLPGVMTVLSGMSTPAQMADNLETFRHFEPLSDAEKAVVEEVRRAIMSAEQIGCTACRYCTDGCPAGLPIPDIFAQVNGARKREPVDPDLSIVTQAANCVNCGQCAQVCPQHLDIPKLMEELGKIYCK